MTNQKIYKKIKKSGLGGALILSLFFTIIMAALIIFSILTIGAYIVDTKLSSEYEKISYLAHLYEEGQSGKYGDVFGLINEDGHDYVVRDKSGKVLYSQGENTCDEHGEEVKLSMKYANVRVYKDTELGFIYPENGDTQIAYGEIWKWFNSDESRKQTNLDALEDDDSEMQMTSHIYDPDDEDNLDYSVTIDNLDEKYLNIPVWLGVEVNDGSEEFIGRALVSVDVNELGFMIILVLVLVIVFMFLNFAFIISAIIGLVRQRRLVKFFFADTTTNGHNRMWYQIKGNELIKSRYGRKNNLAIINLVFVNYRNYCVCHSLAEGEKALKEVYSQIKSRINKKDMCAHVSDSNFALVVKYGTVEEIRERLESMISALEVVDPEHKFSFQAGVSLLEAADGSRESIRERKNAEIDNEYNNACSARSRISDTDESGIVFFDDKLVEEQKWIDAVQEKQALAVANEEFLVYYQPKYDPRTDKLCGAEALIRWESPDYGFITPYKFIPIFEKNGFITEIDHYMITHVARDQKKWLDEGYVCVPVSVNVSRAHFIENDLAEQIRDMVDAEGCPHEYIEIELTESAFFDDKKAMINTINKLKSYGFTVSMDDCGAGYSSLNSLKDMPLDVLKLDADFFRGDSENGRGEIVVSEAIKLAKSLNMKTVAEGVESQEQVEFLAREGCDMIQGYYYAKPMPISEYEERMK